MRLFLFFAALPLSAAALGIVDPSSAEKIKRLVKGDPQAVRRFAQKQMNRGPWTVTAERPTNVDAKANDYYSEAPYWWPDPKNPTGPYIRRDGEFNPGRFMANRKALGEMSDAVLALGLGAYFLDDAAFAGRAALIVRTWFVDPRTRMNPNLEYGQALGGRNTGRGAGLIDTLSLIRAVQGIEFLETGGKWNAADAAAVKQWFREFTQWMTASDKGLHEKKSGNNHSTWWNAQVLAYATYTGDAADRNLVYDQYRRVLIPAEFQPDGSAPKEEARTTSLGYTAFNLDAFATLCRLAEMNGVDLWRFRSPTGFNLLTAFHYAAPYVADPDRWRKQQIREYANRHVVFPGLAGLAYHDESLLRVHRALGGADQPWPWLVDALVRISE